MNAVQIFGPKIRTATIGEVTDSFTNACREHPDVPPQVASIFVIARFQAKKTKK